jgi:hypothetical protein
MADVYTEFHEALLEVQRQSGLGAIRLGRLFSVSRDMMKSSLTGRRRPGLQTTIAIVEGCEAGLRAVLHESLQSHTLRDLAARHVMLGMQPKNVPNVAHR